MNVKTENRPPWMNLIENDGDEWHWVDGRLYHQAACVEDCQPPPVSRLRHLLLHHVYASHNASRAVRGAMTRVLEGLQNDDWALNLGAGATKLHPRIINLDVSEYEGVDIVVRGQKLPFRANSLALVIAQEVLEHLPDPWSTLDEIHRVLRPNGVFYCQVPFIIGRHFGPQDYWRFTKTGLEQLFSDPRWTIQELAPSVGHGTGFYRIAVEFAAVTASAAHRRLYLPMKAIAALVLFPIKFFDVFASRVSEPDRIPGGYFCVAAKRAEIDAVLMEAGRE